jgi:pimeloyl-ACP methyl ester carboxylesterase
MATFVIAHGAWGGGWAWATVNRRLRAAGHDVFTPTYTGLGERAHLLSRETDLETHVRDVVGVMSYEDLREVVLVGHSYGGMVATGAAARAADRVAALVYVDAFAPRDGESLFNLVEPGGRERLAAAAQSDGFGWLIPPSGDPHPQRPGPDRRLPHPLACFAQPLRYDEATIAGLPRTYVRCTDPALPGLDASAARARTEPGWRYLELATDHNPQYTAPAELTAILGDAATCLPGSVPRQVSPGSEQSGIALP